MQKLPGILVVIGIMLIVIGIKKFINRERTVLVIVDVSDADTLYAVSDFGQKCNLLGSKVHIDDAKGLIFLYATFSKGNAKKFYEKVRQFENAEVKL